MVVGGTQLVGATWNLGIVPLALPRPFLHNRLARRCRTCDVMITFVRRELDREVKSAVRDAKEA